MFVLPTSSAPASSNRATAGAVTVAVYAKDGQPAVVLRPATSMLSFTAKGTPQSGLFSGVPLAQGHSRGSELVRRDEIDPRVKVTRRIDPTDHLVDDM